GADRRTVVACQRRDRPVDLAGRPHAVFHEQPRRHAAVVANHALVPSPHELAEAARHALMQCSYALDEAGKLRGNDLLDVVTAPLVRWKLRLARQHRATAKRKIDALHMSLHDRASLGVHNADLWSAITRAVDS